MQLQDQKGGTIDDLNKVTNDFIDALKKRPEIQNAYTSFNPNFPQYLIDVDVASIKNAGLFGVRCSKRYPRIFWWRMHLILIYSENNIV